MGILSTKLTLIYCDSRKRDSSVAILLKEFLKGKNQVCFISSRRNFSKILRLVTPANVVVIGQLNILYDLIYVDRTLKTEFEGMNIYFYPAEGYAMDYEYRMMYPERFTYKHIKKIFFWGRENRDWVAKNVEIRQDQLDNTGYPRLGFAKAYSDIRDPIVRKKIGIVGRFLTLNDIEGMRPMKYILNDFTRGMFGRPYQAVSVKRIVAETESIATVLRVIGYIIEHTDITVSFRPHPNEDRRSYEQLKDFFRGRVEVSEEVDAAEWLAECSKIIGMASSSYIDAFLNKVPIICLDKLTDVVEETLAYEPALKFVYDAVYLPETFEQLTAYLDQEVAPKESPIFEELMRTNFIGDFDDPIKRVADTVQASPGSIRTLFIKAGLDAFDFLLTTRDRLRGRLALDFDYSAAIHKENKRFVSRYLGIHGNSGKS